MSPFRAAFYNFERAATAYHSSPCPEVVITPFDEALHPEFKPIFEPQPESFPLRYFARDPAELPP